MLQYSHYVLHISLIVMVLTVNPLRLLFLMSTGKYNVKRDCRFAPVVKKRSVFQLV